MKIGIIGLPKVGKKTLFEVLTNYRPTEHEKTSNEPIKAVAQIKDARFDVLAEAYKPKKQARARLEIELLPKLEKDTIQKGDIFANIKELDAICHIIRTFEDDSLYHIEGSVDPKRDIEFVNSELLLHDLVFIEKRTENIEKSTKKIKDDTLLKEKELLAKLKVHLDKELPLRTLTLDVDERKMMTNYPFVTQKAMILVLNVSENDINNDQLIKELRSDQRLAEIDIMQVSAKMEAEIATIDSEEERKEFLKELAIVEPAINILARLCIKALNLISFFTVGSDEVRQWTLRAGSKAPQAAGVIHSDLERGFIRVEVMKCSDFIQVLSEAKLKEAGKMYLKGKDYIVEDGDILNVRFSV